jgi:hypothetical protein
MASRREDEEEKALEVDVSAPQLSYSSTDSRTELLRGNHRPIARKKRPRPQESLPAVVVQQQQQREESRQARIVVQGDEQDVETGAVDRHDVADDASSLDWGEVEAHFEDEHEKMPPLKPLPPLSVRSALIITLVLAFAALVVAYVGSGLVLLFHIADHVTPCVRPFWMYSNYVLCAPLLLAILGLTNASPCVRLLFV